MKRNIKILLGLTIALVIVLLIIRNKTQIDKFSSEQWDETTNLLIVSAHWKEDLEWLQSLPYPVIVCGKEGEADSPLKTHAKCKVPNVGYEASSYLKFLTEFYDDLPRHVAFIHGHETAPHQSRDLKELFASDEWHNKDYYYLNFTKFTRCLSAKHDGDAQRVLSHISRVWSTYFEPYLNIPAPTRIECDCCAQFIVSREAIRKYPKSAYEQWYKFLLEDFKNYDVSSWDSAVIFEHLWYILFPN